MGRRLQRDQGTRRQEQHQALRAPDRGCALLADHRAAEYRPDRTPTGGGEEDERDRQRAVHGARRRCRCRCRHRRHGRQVPLRFLATHHGDPQRRQRRQSRLPSATRRGSRSTTRRCIRNIRARIASSAPRLPSAIEAALGTADVPEVVMTSPTAPGVTHRWTNLRAYADEVARPYLGGLPLSVLCASGPGHGAQDRSTRRAEPSCSPRLSRSAEECKCASGSAGQNR